MDGIPVTEDDKERGKRISSMLDFAEIYQFLQNLGPYINLPIISLRDLEEFFKRESELYSEGDQVAYIQWRLLRYTGRSGGKEEWQHMAIKFARKMGLLSEIISYQEASLEARMKIFRLSCEEQLDCNMSLRNNVNREMILPKPLGVDRNGMRYWLLQDSSFDVRLYGEDKYDEAPPISATWLLLAWSLDELAKFVASLEARTPSVSASGLSEYVNSNSMASESSLAQATPILDRRVAKDGKPVRGKHKKSRKTSPEVPDDKITAGCLKCHKDKDYPQMLLCDACDRECHTYCQYPVLWSIPKGKWLCPICKEGKLVQELRDVHTRISSAKARHEQQVIKKEQSIARLQKSGLLLKNIILDEADERRRPRRSHKQVNYAELNDVYLPPLGPRDIVGMDENVTAAPMRTRARRANDYYIQEDYLAPRVRNSSRRFRGTCSPVQEAREESSSASPDESSKKELDIADSDPPNHTLPNSGVNSNGSHLFHSNSSGNHLGTNSMEEDTFHSSTKSYSVDCGSISSVIDYLPGIRGLSRLSPLSEEDSSVSKEGPGESPMQEPEDDDDDDVNVVDNDCLCENPSVKSALDVCGGKEDALQSIPLLVPPPPLPPPHQRVGGCGLPSDVLSFSSSQAATAALQSPSIYTVARACLDHPFDNN